MKTIVTGAAGFIGSNIVKALNERGVTKIIAVDNLSKAEKFKNLIDCEIVDYIDKQDFIERIQAGHFDGDVEAIFHEGACSDTMETDGRYMMENNFRYSTILLDWCLDQDVQFLYASSAATYGASSVFREERECEGPLNVYGYSKFLFDQIVRQRLAQQPSSQIVGFRYFNVYGPRENHKGRMASVAFHNFNQFRADGKVKLFEGSHGYQDGGQMRDFVFVGDVAKVNLFFLDHPEKSGIFNLGSGRAQSFNDVAVAAVNGCRKARSEAPLALEELRAQGLLEYIAFPEALKGKYQAFTQGRSDQAARRRLRCADGDGRGGRCPIHRLVACPCIKPCRILSETRPLVRLQRIPGADNEGRGNVILAKLEGNNPAGSVKDRPALSMIQRAEARGDIKPGDTLIEATSGNTGIALAMAAAIKGYRMILVMPENQSIERRQSMRAYGAELVLTPKDGGMELCRDVAERMRDEGKGIILDQFANPDNPIAHYEGTGPEIWRDTGGRVTHFVSSMGTTGTIMGTSRYLKEMNPAVTIVGCQPEEGSQIPGIRKWPEAYLPKIYAPTNVDRIEYVSQADAEVMTRRLAVEEGIFAGISSGGALAVALRIAAQVENATIVSIVCDRGDRYLSTGVFPA